MLTIISSSRGRQAMWFLIILFNLCLLTLSVHAAEDVASPVLPDWSHILETNRELLSKVESDPVALGIFIGQVGPAAALNDAAATLGAKGIPAKLAQELLLPEIAKSAQRLVAALAAWQLADRVTRSVVDSPGQEAMIFHRRKGNGSWQTDPFPRWRRR